jgi:hypothetical protein
MGVEEEGEGGGWRWRRRVEVPSCGQAQSLLLGEKRGGQLTIHTVNSRKAEVVDTMAQSHFYPLPLTLTPPPCFEGGRGRRKG